MLKILYESVYILQVNGLSIFYVIFLINQMLKGKLLYTGKSSLCLIV